MQKLPAGIQDFSRIREENYLYVDKTQYIFDLINDGVFLFFARPRRFGKSLICSTLKYLYQGRKDLFEGLYIADKIDWNKMNFPVVHIDFSKMDLKKLELDQELDSNFVEICESFHLTSTQKGASADLQMIINHFAKENKKIVLIVDEYDKGLNDFLDNPTIFEENKKILRGFFSRLKPNDIHIEKCFFTGISKYGKISVFSVLNNLTDISLHQKYATMCGATQEELIENFGEYLKELPIKFNLNEEYLLQTIKNHYNGFSFDAETSVYNLYSLLQFFIAKEFKNFWFDTGTPEMLIALLKEQNILVDELEGTEIEYGMLDLADNMHQNVVSLLFQTGYLTLKKASREYEDLYFQLGFPNIEVKQAFSRHLMVEYTQKSVDRISTNIALPLRKAMRNKDFEKIFEILKNSVYGCVPYEIFERKEAYFHTIFHLTFNMIGFRCESQVQNNIGRIDTIVETELYVYIFEFKVDAKQDNFALNQIKNNEYGHKYFALEKPIFAFGINFSSEKRNIENWFYEQLK